MRNIRIFSYRDIDEDKVKIYRVTEEIIKSMEQSEDEELGFNQELVTSKLARNRLERKPI